MAKDLREQGFLEFVKQDLEYDNFLESWYKDHPLLSQLMVDPKIAFKKQKGETEEQTAARELAKQKYDRLNTFVKNFDISLYGGSQEFKDGKALKGSTYRNLDSQALQLLSIYSFLKRDEHVVGNETVQTYMRQFAQNETSPTNFLVSGMYEQFANAEGMVMVDGRLKIVQTFKDIIGQEYERIRREWKNKDAYEAAYKAKQYNNLRLNYNAVLEQDGITPNVLVNGKGAEHRAYGFSKLIKYFEQNKKIKAALIDSAKAGIPFNSLNLDDFTETLSDTRTIKFLDTLEDYAYDQAKLTLDSYVTAGIITPVQTGTLENKDNINSFYKKFGKILTTERYVSDFLSEEQKIQIGYRLESLDSLYGKSKKALRIVKENAEGVLADAGEFGGFNLENFLSDHIFNHLHNSLMFNQMFDGDEALNVKGAVDYQKRNKRWLNSGNNYKNGFHKIAMLNTVQVFLHPAFMEAGQYYSLEDIMNDPFTDNVTKEILVDSFEKGEYFYDVFDGQSYSSIMHQMDGFETVGKLSAEAVDILIAKHYRDITKKEFDTLKKERIVMNPKKTTTSSRTHYLKLSESYIDRNDVSTLMIPEGMDIKEVHAELHAIYSEIYSNRLAVQAMRIAKEESGIKDLEIENKRLIKNAHKYFVAKNSKKQLHVLLNSMELDNVDQVMDTTASKTTTILPVEFLRAVNKDTEYINLEISSQLISNEWKYNQVETSKLKDQSKVSIQRKIIIPADVLHMKEILGRDLTAEEKVQYDNLVDTLADYDQAMKDSAEAGFNTLKTFLRDDNNNIIVGKMYDLIRDNLDSQNSPDSVKDLFKTDGAGNPIINQNIPTIRKMLEYYFFSLYSKATDEKSSGIKYIHTSSYGHNVTVDQNNNVIREEIIEGNPGLYQDNHVRPLGVTTEIGEDGITRYYVEAIVAKPFFINEEDKEFYLEKLNKFFGTRIPTEDKRSMVIVKVVDFLNEAHGNSIILPQFAHYLAGSDFDIDTLYTQMYNVYTDFKGAKQLYGDYSSYRTEDEGRFLEFINYKLNDRDLNRLVETQYDDYAAGNEPSDISAATIEVLNMLGFTPDDLANFIEVSQQDFESVKEELKQSLGQAFNDKKILKLGIDGLKLNIETKKNKGASIRQLQNVFQEIDELNAEISRLKQNKTEFYENSRRATNFYKTALTIESILNVFSEYGLPTSVEKFNSKPEYKYSVRPVYQNSLLTASMDLISNPLVFKNVYSNQKASTESFDRVLDTQEVDYKDVSKNFPYDHHSISGLVSAKVLGQSDKDNVGKSASINKTIAFLNANTLPGESNIKPDAVVWKYNVPVYKEGEVTPSSYKEIVYDTYGILDQDSNRIIQKIGDSIGMFTDAGKEPKPALLGINDANSTFILSSLGLGLNDNLAFNLIRMPEYVNACNAVMNSTKALTRGENVIMTSLYRAVNDEIAKLVVLEPTAVTTLQAQGIVSKNSGVKNIALDKSKIILEINPGPLNKERLLNNTLTLEDLGIEVSYLKTETEEKVKNKKVSKVIVGQEKVILSEVQQKIILLQMMKEQALQSFQLSQIGSLINTMKSFKPDMKSFEFSYDNIVKLKTKQLFVEDDIVDRIFSENKLWSTQYEIVKDLDEQAGVLFLEKSPYFRSIYNLFKTSLKDRSVIASTLSSMLAIYKYRTEYPGTRKGMDDEHQTMIDIDDENLRETFTARYWFGHGLDVQLDELKEKYPKNKFLSFLRTYKTNKFALTSDNRKFFESYIGLMTKAKVSPELENAIAIDAKVLTSLEPLFMSRLFYQDLARTGLQYKQYSYLRYMDASYLKSVSKYMNEFTNKLTTEGGLNVSNAIEQFINSDTIETTYEVLTNIFDTIATLGSEQVDNKNLPKLSFGTDQYYNRFIDTGKIKPEGKQTEDQAIAKYMQEYLDQIVNGIQFNPATYVAQFIAVQISDPVTKVANDVTFNFGHSTAEVNQELNKQIARQFGINYDYQSFAYKFPAFLKLNNGLYVLQSVGDSSNEYSVNYNTLAENFMNTLGTGIDTFGLQAKYKRINKNVSVDQTLSPGTLNQEETETYDNLVATGKRFTGKKTYLDLAYEEETPAEEVIKTGGPSAVKIFKWNRRSAEIGTDADIAMRKIATGAIVEFKSDKVKSSSLTTMGQVGKDSSYGYETDRYVGTSYQGLKNGRNDYGPITMLARNGKLSGTELNPDTKAEIKIAHEQGSKFVLGDMEGVDTQFMDYLNELGATYAIYGHGRLKGISDVEISKPSTSVTGININTKSSDKLGRELTNPNWGAKNIMDIEAEYKANASKIKAPKLSMDEALKYDMNLMYKLQMKKFKAHPELVQEITNRGGVKFLEASEHIVGVKGSRWEGKGTNSNFIKVLIKSYQDSLGTTQPSKVTTSSSVETAETIYSKLGDKTQSENVILPKDVDIEADNIGMTYTTAIDFWRKIVPAAVTLFSKREPLIVAFRGNSKKTFLENYNTSANTIGNPFDFRDETGDRKEQGVISTKKFIEWMITGNNFNNNNATEEYRQAIIKDIKSGKLKKASILYYEEKGYATHATALDYLINEYDWNQPVQASVTTTAEVLSQSPKEILVKYTPKGQDEQVYAVRGSKIINKNGIEVFKENGVDRYKIFANIAVLQKRAVVVTYDNTKYVVNEKQQILNGKTGKIMRWDANNGNTIAILKLASDKFAMNSPEGLPSTDRSNKNCP
jgi:hypothetical protein